MVNQAVEDEITSINAIFAEDTLHQANTSNSHEYALHVVSRKIVLRLCFPDSYPTDPPVILGPETAGSELQKGEANEIVESARRVIQYEFRTGQPCIFDLLDELQQTQNRAEKISDNFGDVSRCLNTISADSGCGAAVRTRPLYTEPQFSVSQVVTEKKSVFVARAASITTPEEAKFCIEYLKNTDKKVAKATHNMTAWRIRSDPSSYVVQHDCDDDGEAAAGGRLLHLLELMGVSNAVVIVSRWFGGILLGPDRFKLMNIVARDALLSGGFAEASDRKNKRETLQC